MSALSTTQSSTAYSAGRRPAVELLARAEWRLLGLILAVGLAGVISAALRQQAVEWIDFVPEMIISLELVLVGACIRRTRHLARTAMGMIAFGMIVCFLACYAILTFTVLPFVNPMVDQQLLAADAAIGFSWVDSVNLLSFYPKVAIALRHVYFSIMPQIVLLVFWLSFLRRDVELHRFLAVGFMSMIVSVGIWWLVPSVGPAAYAVVSEEVQQKTQLVANADYGERMWRYATQGNLIISKSKLDGVIAFPSMHIVMTFMVIWFARKTWLFFPVLGLNLAMPFATVLHGGHHVMDVFGGIFVFVVCLMAANRLVPARKVEGTAIPLDRELGAAE